MLITHNWQVASKGRLAMARFSTFRSGHPANLFSGDPNVEAIIWACLLILCLLVCVLSFFSAGENADQEQEREEESDGERNWSEF